MTKRIVICSDGTWNKPDQAYPTNVTQMERAISPTASDGTVQIVLYDEGVGTSGGLDRWMGGVFGRGLEKNVAEAYRFLIHNYDDGDDIFLFGFSRGAYTSRSIAGLIRNCGILHKDHADKIPEAYALYRQRDASPDTHEAVQFRNQYSREVEIYFVGVWDTVGALGIPFGWLRWLNKGRHQFHDVTLSGMVRNAYHAVSIDEKRKPFRPSLWKGEPKTGQRVEQVWFAGDHSDIGGGYRDSSLSDVAFEWMKEKAETCGLGFDKEYVGRHVHANPFGRLHDTMSGMYGSISKLPILRSTTVGPHVRSIGFGAGEAVHKHRRPTASSRSGVVWSPKPCRLPW